MSSLNLPSISISDKAIHFVFYAIFAILLYIPFRVNKKKALSIFTTVLLVVLIGVVLGSIIELVQHHLIVGRFGEYLDLLANTAGLLIGVIISEVLYRKAVL